MTSLIRNTYSLATFKHKAHLCCICPYIVTDNALLESYYEILTYEEKDRYHLFAFEKDRHTFLVAHSFVRSCLSKHSNTFPKDWTFTKDEYGKPSISQPCLPSSFYYSLSYTKGLIVCLLASFPNIGIDVEYVDYNFDTSSVIERSFSSADLRYFSSRPNIDKVIRFYELWTLKEAFVKAKGTGLSTPFDSFSFDLLDDNDIRISFNDELKEDPKNWFFAIHRLSRRHICSVAFDSINPNDIIMTFEEWSGLSRIE